MNEIKKFASAEMHTDSVIISSDVNKFVWSQGIRNVPNRVRVKLIRKRAEADGKTKMVCHVEIVPTGPREYKGKLTETVEVAKGEDDAEDEADEE